MNAAMLFTLGTPHGGWLPTAAALAACAAPGLDLRRAFFTEWLDEVVGAGPKSPRLELVVSDTQISALAALAPDGMVWGGLDARACWTIDALAAAFPQAGFLIFVESPAAALAAWLVAGHGGDPADALQRWSAGARRLLHHAYRYPQRCVLVDAAEARNRVPALAVLCAERFGLALRGAVTAPAVAEPLSAALGAALAGHDRATETLYAELYATCLPLDEAAGAVPPVGGGFDAAAAVHRWHEMHRAMTQLRDGTLEMERERDVIATAARALQSELDALRGDAQRIHAAHEQAAAAAAQNLEQLDTLRREVESRAVTTQVVSMREQAIAARLDDALRQADAERGENELLFVQLRQVQQELEHYYLECKKLETEHVALPRALHPAARLEMGTERDTPPHRELGFVLHAPAADDGPARVELRLVEHRGRPGLVVFAAEGPRQLLSVWQESGREDGRPYQLLVPADAASAPYWQCMPSSDWLKVHDLLDWMEAVLLRTDPTRATRWHSVVGRLCVQLAEMPARLRYDRIEVRAAGEGRSALEVVFKRVLFAARRFDSLRLHWCPGEARPVELLAQSPAEPPPLAAWPTDDADIPKPRWSLPLSTGIDAAEGRRCWGALPALDRELLLGVLDALPAAAECVSDAELPPGYDRAALARAAAQLFRDAQQALRPTRRQRLTRLLRGQPALAA